MAQIIAFGNPVYDEIITPVIATPGRVLSGCSTNACLALQRLGHQTTLVGRVGEDYLARFRQDLARFGVAMYAETSVQTGGFRLIYDQWGDRTLEVLGQAEPIRQIPAESASADALIIGPILQETPLDFIRHLRAQSAAPIFLDPQGLLRRLSADGMIEHYLPDDFVQLAPYCHVIKANELEAQIITGIAPRENPIETAQRLHALGCTIAIVTLAEAGSVIVSDQGSYVIPAYATEARDPTGAGDTYMAGFIHAYLSDPTDLYRAGCMGSATSSIWIEHTGPEAPISLVEAQARAATL